MTMHNAKLVKEKFVLTVITLALRNILVHGKNELLFTEVQNELGLSRQAFNFHKTSKSELLKQYGIHWKNSSNNKKSKCFYIDTDKIIALINQLKSN